MIRLLLLGLVVSILVWAVLRWRRGAREDAIARARAAFFVSTVSPPLAGREPAPMRDLGLGEGRLAFRVPRAWDDERSRPGACEVRASSSRVLRVEVLETPVGGPRDAEGLAESLRATQAGRQGVVTLLDGGRVLVKHVQAGSDERGPHLEYCWDLHAPLAAGSVVARFGFRVPGSTLDAITEDDLRLLEREIRGARLSGAG